MLQRLRCKIFINLILFILVIQLRHLVQMYEMSRISFNVPMIEHLQKTPIEQEIKNIYRDIPQARENDRVEHNYPRYCITGCWATPVIYY